ncbi:MAG: MFS transporter [Magnetococcales bacterium]|nr:MFS transporter [Magnetococcales bacterium]
MKRSKGLSMDMDKNEFDGLEATPYKSALEQKDWTTFYLVSAVSTLVISLTVALQPLFLDEVIVIPYEEEGTINAHLQVVTQIISLALIFFLGPYWSNSKRLKSVFYGFLLAALGAALVPFSKNIEVVIGFSSLTFYYIMRILISLGTDTVQMQLSTLGGDATLYQKKPILLPNMITMMALGSTVICAILMQIPKGIDSVPAIMLIPFFVACAGAYIVNRYMPKQQPVKEASTQLPFAQAWELISSDPRMQLCFAAAFYVRADMLVISLFLSLWFISFADVVGVSRAFAAGQASLMLGYIGLVILIAMPMWRRYMETNSRISAIGASLSLTGLGFVAIGWLVSNPFDWHTMLFPLLLVGIGQAGCLIAPKILAAELAPKHVLGSVQGVLFLVSGIGVVMLVQSGGYYFDAVGPKAPFILIGASNLLVMLYALWLIKSGMDESREHKLEKKSRSNLKPLLFMFSLLPIIWLVGRIMIGGITPGSSLGQMPVGFINRYLGDWAFNFILLSLALRPVAEITKVKLLMQYSRMIGLYAFFYASLHVATYFWLEWLFNLHEIIDDISKRPFIILGMLAFAILIVLAVTSTKSKRRELGNEKWKKIHKSVYLVNILIALHFWLAATHENGEPYVYAIAVFTLLAYRWKQIKEKKGRKI